MAGGTARVEAIPERGLVGGGSVPGFELPSWVVAVQASAGAERIAERLRGAPVPVLARVRDDRVLIDVRTLLDDDDVAVESALMEALRPEPR
jgi:L-seryl-tRNA(Ser) seleniumtransferase